MLPVAENHQAGCDGSRRPCSRVRERARR